MSEPILNVQMLGEFSISFGDIKLSDKTNRSRKIWLLLAYLIHNRKRIVSQEELVSLLWGSEEKNDNPGGALKTTLWRARQTLEALEPSIGRDLIVRRNGGYQWNAAVQTRVDAEEFEGLCRGGRIIEDEDTRLDAFRKALSLYRGDFLGKMAAELWASPIAAYYHSIYVDTLLESLPLLRERGYLQEVEDLCRTALQVEPYQETIYQHLMRSLLERGQCEEAVAVYEEMREELFSNLGVMPDEESQVIYREISRNVNGYAFLPEAIREELREEDPSAGAMVCDYALFKFFYQAEARSAARRGDAIHIGILSVTDADGKELAKRSLDRAMENLRVQLQRGLRRSDIVSQCSTSQFVLMLLQANYEDSCMVCERVIRAFARAYPHSPARIHYTVLPLEPLSDR